MAQKLRYPTSQDYVQKTLGASLLAGVTAAATLNNVTGIQNLPGVFIVDRVDTTGAETPTKREVIQYDATSGVTTTTLTRNADGSGTDQDHAVGAIVEFGPDILWAQAVIDGLTQVLVASTGLVDTTKVVDLTTAQALSNKTLTSPIITGLATLASTSLIKPLFADRITLPKGETSPFNTITDASTMYIDFSLGNKFLATIVPSGSRTFLATNATVGDFALLRVQYASSASLALNILTANATISWPGNTLPVPTAVLGKADNFGLMCMATLPKFDGTVIGQNY